MGWDAVVFALGKTLLVGPSGDVLISFGSTSAWSC